MSSRVVMPKLSDTMEEGVLLKWYKHEGDRVESGDVLAEIETDKAVMDLEAYASGILKKVLVQEKSVVPAGDLIAIIAGEDEEVEREELKVKPKAQAVGVVSPSQNKKAPPMEKKPPAQAQTPLESVPHEAVIASPLARSMAREEGIDLSRVQGSGPGGRIIKRDLESFVKATPTERQAKPGPMVVTPYDEKPLSMMRKSIAKRMVQSKAPVPHFYVTSEVDMGASLALKNSLESLEGEVRVSITDLWVKALAITLQKFAQINASYHEEKIRFHQSVHIGIAVGLEDGLIVPVLRNCEQKRLRQIAQESKLLIEKARSRRLTPEEYTGATFSISNLGMVDVESFSAIITPPEAAVLALGSIREVPIVTDGRVGVGHRMKVTLSCDHRVIDGLQAAEFLKECKKILEHPVLLIL